MSSDTGKPLPGAPRPDFTMPRMLDIQMRETKFEAPHHRNFTSALTSGDGVEFIVKTDGPIPGRALGPALYIGETVVTEVTEIGPNTYRFVATSSKGLTPDAPISLRWTGQPPSDSTDAAFRFRL
ncbi:hypothetical protein [Paraburkholderia hospita]|uniref:hypothetical protein n=1 Tax=Paraburkholderia hospita TaxID=169430 RepID=UPI000B342039|nr:hypothetical protein [Paraburkholderia hospita]OUL74133.1 hypothetical protein CA603_42275 [Paraburkholderia hospita]